MLQVLTELERRWQAMFEQLADGLDVPPGQRLRAEGLMEALALMDPGCEARLQAAMDVAYHRVNGRSLAQDFGEDWESFYPFPQIPVAMTRAPVYPSAPENDHSD